MPRPPGLRRGEPGRHVLVAHGHQVVEGGEPEGVVAVRVGDDDDLERDIGRRWRRRPHGPTLRRARPGVDEQRALVAGEQDQVHRVRLGDARHTPGASSSRARRAAGCGRSARRPARNGHGARLALTARECQGRTRRGRRPAKEVVSAWTTASCRCSAPSSPTTCPARSRSGPRRWSTSTTSASPRPRSATTWRRWRRRATSRSPTPARAASRPTRATGCSSTGSARSSRSHDGRAARDPDLPVRGARPRRHPAAHRPAARPGDAAGRDRAVPDAQHTPRSATSSSSRCPATRLLLVLITSTGPGRAALARGARARRDQPGRAADRR